MEYKKIYVKTIAALILIYSTFFISSLYRSDFYGNIFSPIACIATFALMYQNTSRINKDEQPVSKRTWTCLTLAVLAWTISDIVWSYYYFFTPFDPEESLFLIHSYSVSNVFLFVSEFVFAVDIFKKWNMLQLILDSVSIALSTIILLWVVYFNSSFEIVKTIAHQHAVDNIMFVLDIASLIGILVAAFSIRQGKINFYSKLVIFGVFVFMLGDLHYLYQNFYDLYSPNTMTDFTYMIGFLLIAIGSITKNYKEQMKIKGIYTYINVGFQQKRFTIFIFPVIALLFKNFDIHILTNFLIIIVLREILSSYLQKSIEREKLLSKEKEMNMLLEDKIRQRTKEISIKNKELEIKNIELDFMSKKDHLTNLCNRRYFFEKFNSDFLSSRASGKTALFYIDLDRFKIINDMYGHHVGDKALIQISSRLKKYDSDDSILARLGGDEFVFVKYGDYEYEEFAQLADSIIQDCNAPIEIGEYMLYVSASIGISIYPTDAKDSYTLMKNADLAMHEMKDHGKNGYIFFDSKFSDKANRKLVMENLLKNADYDKEFNILYQPQFSIDGKKITGAEALLRWNNSELGNVSPEEFIPIAEETDCINSIGEWVMEKAIKQSATWNNMSYDIKVGINVSPKQLDSKNLIEKLTRILEENSLSPKYIDIEITENVAVAGEYKINQINSLFGSLGVSVSIDDFGTGYSSLSYLKIFPFERIKIAKPLIDVIATDSFDYEIVKAVITLAKSIGIKTIAEGVESRDQLEILTRLGCDEVQGFLLGKPMDKDEFEILLKKQLNSIY